MKKTAPQSINTASASTGAPSSPPRTKRAFTLAEMELSLSITVLIGAMAMAILIFILKLYVVSDIKTCVSEDYRALTRQISEEGSLSNGFFIYPSFATTDRDSPEDQVPAGQSGDFVVFISFSIKDIKNDPNYQRVSRIFGFFRENSGVVTSRIRWFDSAKHNWGQSFSAANPASLPIPASGTNYAVESLLPPEAFKAQCPVLAQHTMGGVVDTAGTSKLNLFYNSTSTNNAPCFILSGFILRDVTSSGAGVAGYESETAFNLTVSPRSN